MKEEVDGKIPAGEDEESPEKVLPFRYSDCSIIGTREKIASDIIIPDSRIKAIPEVGTQSNSGDIGTEWNIDEQDNLFAAVMCSDWEDDEEKISSGGYEEYKTLKLSATPKRRTFSVIKKYTQAPIEFQHFKNEQVSKLQIGLELNKFVKLTWSMMGANHPLSETTDPLESIENCEYGEASTTKSFKTLNGYFKIGNSFEDMQRNRQCPSFSLTIDNGMNPTDALFEEEAIENSLGDFSVTGSFDVWKADDFARELSNDAINGAEKYIEVALERVVGDKVYSYITRLIVHLDESKEGNDGNKLKNTIAFTVGRVDGLEFIKTVKAVD